jgi:hypothetical protein
MEIFKTELQVLKVRIENGPIAVHIELLVELEKVPTVGAFPRLRRAEEGSSNGSDPPLHA